MTNQSTNQAASRTTDHDQAPPPPASGGGDPRDGFARAVAIAGAVIAAVRPDQLDRPTPCDDFVVRDLLGHLVSVLRRVEAVATGGSALDVAPITTGVADGGWAETWEQAAAAARRAFADPAVLGRTLTLPFGDLPGAAAMIVYTGEVSVHTWDLAVATAQQPAWDDDILVAPLAASRRELPVEPRGGPVPFGPVVDVSGDAPLIDQLVAWQGRRPV
jgi:uncharacterized protein (TIGR03086 family)